jgi:predicted metal-dependent phosphoesterase TrpH
MPAVNPQEGTESMPGDLIVVAGTFSPDMALADVHVHTRFSDGWFTVESLAEAALIAGLQAVVVTDHDEVAGGFELRNYCSRRQLPLTVYPGSEVTARFAGNDIHILALGIEDDIPPWQDPEWTIDAILHAGGVPVLAHPFKSGSGYLSSGAPLNPNLPVAIEVVNTSIADIDRFDPRRRNQSRNDQALELQNERAADFLGPVGGTDAHFRTVGRGLTAYRGDLLDAIRDAETAVLTTTAFERARPPDFFGYARGLRRIRHRRAAKWGSSTR